MQRLLLGTNKSMPIVAWYVLSNVSYMKRVISEVLPTVHEYEYESIRLAS